MVNQIYVIEPIPWIKHTPKSNTLNSNSKSQTNTKNHQQPIPSHCSPKPNIFSNKHTAKRFLPVASHLMFTHFFLSHSESWLQGGLVRGGSGICVFVVTLHPPCLRRSSKAVLLIACIVWRGGGSNRETCSYFETGRFGTVGSKQGDGLYCTSRLIGNDVGSYRMGTVFFWNCNLYAKLRNERFRIKISYFPL